MEEIIEEKNELPDLEEFNIELHRDINLAKFKMIPWKSRNSYLKEYNKFLIW